MIELRSSAMRLAGAVLLVAWFSPVSWAQRSLFRGQYNYPEEEIHVHDLPVQTAKSEHSFDMLAAAVASGWERFRRVHQ
jgi:hypothetical protein